MGFHWVELIITNVFEVASSFVTKQGVSMFKFDGVGMGNGTEGANAAYEKDIDALLKLIPDLRSIKPDLYFSLTLEHGLLLIGCITETLFGAMALTQVCLARVINVNAG